MSATMRLLDWVGECVARQLSKPTSGYEPYAAARPELVAMIDPAGRRAAGRRRALQDQLGDPLSHPVDLVACALYVGLGAGLGERDGEPLVLVEAELGKGVIASPLSKFATYNTRICRPVGLTPEDRHAVIRYVAERIGYDYDLKNIIDLMRYFLPQPPVPARWRRRMIALGSGEPTRAICSSLIAQAFESVGYPILPEVHRVDAESRREILHIRHHSLYTPRDFDISPFFAYRQADDRDGIRLQADDVGQEDRPKTRRRAEGGNGHAMNQEIAKSRSLTILDAAGRAARRRRPQIGRRLLSRQDRQRLHRRRRRRRIRHPGAPGGAAYRQAHPRQSDRGAAEHDRRGRPADDQLPLQRRAEGRHQHRHDRQRLPGHAGGRHRRACSSTPPRCNGSARSRRRSRPWRSGTPPASRASTMRASREVVAGASARGAITFIYPQMMNELLGTKFKIVTGYPGGNQINLAMERGEVEARNNTWSSWKATKAAWLRDKKITVIAQAGPRAPDLDAPSVEDAARTPEERQLIELVVSGTQFGRPLRHQRRAGRSRRGAARRLRRHHEGPGVPGRGQDARLRGRSGARREDAADRARRCWRRRRMWRRKAKGLLE